MGLEPTTPCLKGRCSNRLSYGPICMGKLLLTLSGLDETCQSVSYWRPKLSYVKITDRNRNLKYGEYIAMSGHSKWSTIKRQKGAKDAARGAVFTKLGNTIAVAARSGTDPETNFGLRLAIDKAKAANMPMSNIQRAIDRQKDKDAAQLQELLYEGYGPGGVAIIVECTTDNLNRTYSEIKVAFSRHGGSLAEKGSVAFQFNRRGVIRLEQKGDSVLEAAIDSGADDIVEEDDGAIVYTDPKELNRIRLELTDKGLNVLETELAYVPKTTVKIDNVETAGKILRLMDALDDQADVSNTYVNFDIPQDILAQLD